MNNQPAQIIATDRAETVLESRMGHLGRALVDLDEAVGNAIRRMEPLLTPYPLSMPANSGKEAPAPVMSPHILSLEKMTVHIIAIRERLDTALANAQL